MSHCHRKKEKNYYNNKIIFKLFFQKTKLLTINPPRLSITRSRRTPAKTAARVWPDQI